ncbi:glycosyltransferase family 4 protein [Neolewinella aurantiaca]|uniref:Glycosyltransferase family 4 protein n=1 Tax=Neolewinella aurantiaca TaxID=2602767 RepID=A0A5C7FLP5_9BACT|nr:glycosyltransferase [Neolewinella aurantiaca]TXF90941.1 glycosyltransferase family 4 protein [Neolewinella aurantiaca]
MKRVLLITYYWPPSGGITVLRMLKFAKYLRATGWEPVIFTAEGAHYPTIDPTNERDVPQGIEIIRQRIWEPYSLYKKFMGKPADENVNNVFYTDDADGGWKHKAAVWVRSNFFIPDARATWIKGSVKRLNAYLAKHPVEAILSDGPPHSNTRIATLVSRATGTPWLADFQDPWTQVDYYQLLNLTRWGRNKHERQEQEAFAQAKRTTIVSPSWKHDLEAIGAKNVEVIPYGYDPEDFADLKRSAHQKFTLTHLGIMGYDRNPVNLFAAIALLKKELPDFADDFELRLFGQLDYRVKENILAAGIGDQTNFAGNVARAEALQQQVDSHLLLLLLNQQENAKGRIPGKLFEYLAARRPILNFGGTDSDVAGILNETKSGSTFGYDASPQEIARVLKEAYSDYKSGKAVQMDAEVIKAYSHPVLVKKLGELLDEMTAQSPT